MTKIKELRKELKKLANPRKAKILQRFFKTGIGEYAEGDIFLGITVPQSRKIAIKYQNLPLSEIKNLLKSKIHEERLIALLILVDKFNRSNILENVGMKKDVYEFYLKNTKYINNWDLVDLSADKIVGGYLFNRGPVTAPIVLIKLAKSKNIWERRIAIIATYNFIKNGKFDVTLKIAEILLQDQHDLIQKAVGWMLREVGKRDLKTEIEFLKKYYKKMPRTMLRYSIEKFPGKMRIRYLKNKSL